MNNMRNIWSNRFVHYITELQKYLQFIFTGHTALVLVFTIGAGGYAYSEWLKEVPATFPAAIITAIVLGAVTAYSPPVTLLREADLVFFLPFEAKIHTYLSRALRWTFFSQILLPVVLVIVALPLLKATHTATTVQCLQLLFVVILVKWSDVETEYNVRHAKNGEGIWTSRGIRFVLAAITFYTVLQKWPIVLIVLGLVISLYSIYWRKRKSAKPVPFEHFIQLEQNRMMRFYRFANYFTDVPHLKGAVSRRRWLSFVLREPNFNTGSPQSYLIRRTFLRTDDLFWLWVRLTGLSVIGVILIPFPILVILFVGALAFASSIQLVQGLRGSDEFRMDMLFPEEVDSRPVAVRRFVRSLQWLQAAAVALVAVIYLGISLSTICAVVGIVIISELTVRFSRSHSKDE